MITITEIKNIIDRNLWMIYHQETEGSTRHTIAIDVEIISGAENRFIKLIMGLCSKDNIKNTITVINDLVDASSQLLVAANEMTNIVVLVDQYQTNSTLKDNILTYHCKLGMIAYESSPFSKASNLK